jgi:hypothetical protein
MHKSKPFLVVAYKVMSIPASMSVYPKFINFTSLLMHNFIF